MMVSPRSPRYVSLKRIEADDQSQFNATLERIASLKPRTYLIAFAVAEGKFCIEGRFRDDDIGPLLFSITRAMAGSSAAARESAAIPQEEKQ